MDQNTVRNINQKENMESNTEKEVQENGQKSGYYINRPQFGKQGPSKLRQQFGRGMSLLVIIVAGIIIYFAMLRLDDISEGVRFVLDVLKPVIYGLSIAYLLNPIVEFVDHRFAPILQKRFSNLKSAASISRGIGIFVSIVFLFAIIVALFNMLIPELFNSIRDMVISLPGQLNHALDKITEMMSGDSTLGQVFTAVLREGSDYLQNWLRTDLMKQINIMMSNLTSGVINVFSGLFDLLIGLIISIYVLFSKEKFGKQSKKIVYAVFKPSHANMILHLTLKSNEIFGGFIIGKLIDSAIIGVLCFIGLSILNMPYALLVSVIVGVTNVIPFFGPYIGAIPSAVLIMLADPRKGLYFILFILVLQQIDGNIIGPKILGDSTGLSAFWVVFSILLGGGLFGFVGMILGVPTFAVIYYVINMLINHRLEVKKLPTETECYDKLSYVDSDGTYVHSDDNEINKR